jgi:hypothetical protein
MAKKARTEAHPPGKARRTSATFGCGRPLRRAAIAGKDFSPRPMPRPAKESDLAPSESSRPMTNPRRSDADRSAGTRTFVLSRASRTTCCAVKRFAEGGMVTGSRAQLSGTKFSGTF